MEQQTKNTQTAVTPSTRILMAGKPVLEVNAKSVINFHSNFDHKDLCDGLTWTNLSSCAFSCSYCYVEDLLKKNPHKIPNPEDHRQIVIRRKNAVEIARNQLTYKNGRSRFEDKNDRRVIFSSPLADIAANMDLVNETVEICRVILQLTNWQIRLLSKSNLLLKVAEALEGYRDRMIYGFSTGTLDDKLGAAFETGTPLVSKRIKALRELQDNGFRVFAMICPSLVLANDEEYKDFAEKCAEELRTHRCEHVWAECINVRGESMTRTCTALSEAGYADHAQRVREVSTDNQTWEAYARSTFLAHAQIYERSPGKLKFLQYVKQGTRAWWENQRPRGAILLR